MPFNGTGTFVRLYTWVTDAANSILVRADRMDAEMDGMATALSDCITRDGQSPATANLPMGGFKFTGLGSGSAPTDSVNYGQVFSSPQFTTPYATTNPASSDSSLLLATTYMVQQVAFAAALPTASRGLVQNDGTGTAFSKSIAFGLNYAKAADVASASAPDIWSGNGNTLHITGTTTLTGFAAAPQAGARRRLYFDSACLLTNGANFNVQGGANYTTAAGDMVEVYADTATKFYLSVIPVDGQQPVATPYLKLSDQKAAGSSGGTSLAADITQTRTLNTVEVNTITGASLAGNTVTLPAGTYDFYGRAPSCQPGATKALLYNSSDSTYTGIGSSIVNQTGSSYTIDSTVFGRFTITASKNFTIRHYTTSAFAASGLGLAANMGQLEVFTELEFWKVA